MRCGRTVLAGLALAWAAAVAAQPVNVAGLQRALQGAARTDLRFHETRESPWLATPVESSGRMKSSATMLEKVVEQPRPERWQILDDRMQLVGADPAALRSLMFSDAPAVAALAQALRQVMAGDLLALEKDFHLRPSGDAGRWSVQMAPRRPDIARHLKEIELRGSGAQLQSIVILEARGERTTTHLTAEH